MNSNSILPYSSNLGIKWRQVQAQQPRGFRWADGGVVAAGAPEFAWAGIGGHELLLVLWALAVGMTMARFAMRSSNS